MVAAPLGESAIAAAVTTSEANTNASIGSNNIMRATLPPALCGATLQPCERAPRRAEALRHICPASSPTLPEPSILIVLHLYVVSAFRRTCAGPAKAGHYVQMENAIAWRTGAKRCPTS